MVKLNKKETSCDISNSGMALLGYVEKLERLKEEADGIADDKKEVMGEAKATGFDAAILRKVLQRRAAGASTVEEVDSLIETYETAIAAAEKAQLKASEAAAK